MLSRLLLAVAFCQLALLCSPAAAVAGDEATIRSIRAEAIEYSAHGHIEDALSSFDNAVRMAEQVYGKESSYVADLCFDEGLAALKADQYKKAEQCLQRAVAVTPNAVEARLKLAELYKKRGMMSDAKQQVQRVLQRHPDNFEAREILALTYQQEGNFLAANKECFNLSRMAQAHEAADQHVAFVPPPPAAVAPPPAAATTVAVPAAAAVSGIAALRAGKPTVKKPEPAKKQVPPAPPPAPAKKGKDKREQKQVHGATKQASVAASDNGPESSWGLPARLHSTAVLLTPVGKNKSAKAESESAITPKKSAKQLKAEAAAARRAEAAKKAEALAAKAAASKKAAAEAKATQKADAARVAAAKKADAEKAAAATKKADAEKTAAAKPEPKKSKGPSVGEEPASTSDNSADEEGFGGSSVESSKAKSKPAPAPKPKPVVVKIEAPKRGRAGLVPPPPPVVPSFQPMVMPPPAAVAAPVAKPKPKPAETKAAEKPASHGADDDTDFLLEWGGGKKKSK